jgi:hypothetical protein
VSVCFEAIFGIYDTDFKQGAAFNVVDPRYTTLSSRCNATLLSQIVKVILRSPRSTPSKYACPLVTRCRRTITLAIE